VEPYVIAADVYSGFPHGGRGGWTWYTGSAAWMYRAGLESILGLNVSGNQLTLDPHIHPSWPSYNIKYRHHQTVYEIEVKNPKQLSSGSLTITVDGKVLEANSKTFELVNDNKLHSVTATLDVS
jgi:cyclic beta-1,2-glucan synthetase